jgi:CBS domain-containing protein
MSSPPITTTSDTSIEKVADIMFNNGIGSVMIVDDEGMLIGIITERDMIYAIAKHKLGKELPAWMIMTENPVTINPGASIVEATKLMREANIRHLPVVNKEGKPLGMLSLRDVIDAILTLMHMFITGE